MGMSTWSTSNNINRHHRKAIEKCNTHSTLTRSVLMWLWARLQTRTLSLSILFMNCKFFNKPNEEKRTRGRNVNEWNPLTRTHRSIHTLARYQSSRVFRFRLDYHTKPTNTMEKCKCKLQNTHKCDYKNAFQSTALNAILLSSRYLLLMTWTFCVCSGGGAHRFSVSMYLCVCVNARKSYHLIKKCDSWALYNRNIVFASK